VDPFNALIQSFGTHLVTTIGASNLEQLIVRGHEGSGFAEVDIVLSDKTWDGQISAIGKVAEVRLMFIDELSFSYQFFDSLEDVDDEVEYDEQHALPAYSLA
jgi:hypothetical protein